jgi:hypothetical protein
MQSEIYVVKTDFLGGNMPKITSPTEVITAHASKAHKPFHLLFPDPKRASETAEEDKVIGSPFFFVQSKRARATAEASHAGA